MFRRSGDDVSFNHSFLVSHPLVDVFFHCFPYRKESCDDHPRAIPSHMIDGPLHLSCVKEKWTMARAASHQNIGTCLTNIALKNGGEKVCSFDSVKLKLFMVLKIRTLRLLVWWQSLEASIYQHGWSSFELWVLSAHPNPQRAGIPSAATTQLVSMVENYRDLSMRHEMSLNSMWRFFVDRSCRSLSRPKTSTVSSKERCLVRITSYQQLLLHLRSSWGCPMVSKTAKQLFQFYL